MEFRFSIQPIFPDPIVKINYHLLPAGFGGDRRTSLDVATKCSEIINEIGEASAQAQGLAKAVTTAQKIRQCENQNVYLLGDIHQGRNGAVLGMLKVGKKSLYVFDKDGNTRKVDALCVLDFYIHETRQRSGLGKKLFDKMLEEERCLPVKLAIDRPSDKLMGFLRKHYGLEKFIQQNNNFVVYEGFFDDYEKAAVKNQQNGGSQFTASPNTALFGTQYINDEAHRRCHPPRHQNTTSTCMSLLQHSPVGRYAAGRPSGSMGEIINGTPTPATGEPKRGSYDDQLYNEDESSQTPCVEDEIDAMNVQAHRLKLGSSNRNSPSKNEFNQTEPHHFRDDEFNIGLMRTDIGSEHTGLKNISSNVEAAVSPTNIMDFGGGEPGCHKHDLDIYKQHAAGRESNHENGEADMGTLNSGAGEFTDQGYFDLKYHHNKLW